ncbi:HD-GYP domain-containing protein [Ferrimonas balearica]|uniref:HD-GYP domain-containing protein n=1 Tax=Ferrimonas balearica TaxID=44012 RepID=UPI001C99A1AE|nr:HD domain-containing phosphohydrolase [Ferrimonas balearica]MBY5922312.1 DUF3391 domain-containing protein [Ferrimonas balearica]MBY5994348.1 DUF3391 domain-containing protein [Ferrimonas balearica]
MSSREFKIPVNALQVGQSIRLPLAWKEHPFMFNRFRIKDEGQILLIRKLGLSHVFLQLAEGEQAPVLEQAETPTSPSLPQGKPDRQVIRAHQAERDAMVEESRIYRRLLKKCEQAYGQSIDTVRSSFNRIATSPEQAYADSCAVVEEILTQFEHAGSDTVLQLVAANQEGSMQCHAINVAVVALVLGRALGLEGPQLRELGLAALVHDVGKLRIPSSILNKRSPLNKAEQNYLRQHPKLALEMLRGTPFSTKSITTMVVGHHEYLDGSGYPQKLSGNAISPMTQILTIANEYDSLVNGNTKTLPPYQALAYMFKCRSKQLNSMYLQTLVKTLGVYPPGTLVRLENGQVGKVLSSDASQPLFPTLILYDAEIPKIEAPMVSLEMLGLKVEAVLRISELSEAQCHYLDASPALAYYVRR